VVYPEVNGQRGNPVAFSGEVIAEMLESGKNVGCRKFIDANPAIVHKLQTTNDRFIIDLDTQDDIAAFEKRTGWKLTMPDTVVA
jgi:CTP:molybdopterin cytidylyltransferase MocA